MAICAWLCTLALTSAATSVWAFIEARIRMGGKGGQFPAHAAQQGFLNESHIALLALGSSLYREYSFLKQAKDRG